jgi:simple sugar transport system permease protein
MTAGRGYIALAALILGGWRPVPALLATILFGFASAVQIQLKGTELAGANIPSGVWSMLPYLVTLIALAGFVGKQRTPGGLGKV